MRKSAFWVLLVALFASHCGAPQQSRPRTYSEEAEAAYFAALGALEDSNYALALSSFRRVRESYELSPYAVLAELRIGDVHFEEGNFLQAAEAYRQFVQMHPSHDAVPYARFRIGMSYFEDMPSDFFILPPPYERELTSTRSASQTLGDFLERYGNSSEPELQDYIFQARAAYQEAMDRLAGFEFYVGEFYLERNRPVAAAQHFNVIVDEFPGSTLVPNALFLLARCFIELYDVESALEVIDQLRTDHPQHELAQEATAWLGEHGLAR